MNCRDFRTLHLDFTDRTLDAPRCAEALEHIEACADCARFDALVRRSLMLVHSLPPVAPDSRAHARIMAAAAHRGGASERYLMSAPRMVAAASLAFTVGALFLRHSAPAAASLPPVVASAVIPAPTPIVARIPERAPARRSDLMAAPAGGIPLWPAASFVDESPARFASIQLTSWIPAR